MVFSLVFTFLISVSGLMVDGLPGAIVDWQPSGNDDYGNISYDIALSLDEGESFSDWVAYPPVFNSAKTYCRYSSETSTLEVTSQLPFTAEYTYAWYNVEENGSLVLSDYGYGHYYENIQDRVSRLLEAGEFDEAILEAYSVMYPGSMPYPDSFCALYVVAAAKIGSLEAFERASDICMQIANTQIYLLADSSLDYINALEDYAEMSDETSAGLIMERLAEYE